MANAILSIRAELKELEKSCFQYEVRLNVARKIGTSQVYRGDLQLLIFGTPWKEVEEEEDTSELLYFH